MLRSNHFRMQLLVSCIFLLLTASSVAGTKDNASTPKFDSIRVDALDADAWNGVVFAARAFGQPSDFAFRFGSFSQTLHRWTGDLRCCSGSRASCSGWLVLSQVVGGSPARCAHHARMVAD